MSADDDQLRRAEILEEGIPRAEEIISQYKVGIEHQYRVLINLHYELGCINERIGDDGDHA